MFIKNYTTVLSIEKKKPEHFHNSRYPTIMYITEITATLCIAEIKRE